MKILGLTVARTFEILAIALSLLGDFSQEPDFLPARENRETSGFARTT